ncbi:hypothetical protein GALL_503490 [mine drainage metagenome]|uniref:Uncharacterized protein n=1 Tax=mine drainage metagenome TaxID=410659 RepID=A0A1J5PA34_9ZZZZ
MDARFAGGLGRGIVGRQLALKNKKPLGQPKRLSDGDSLRKLKSMSTLCTHNTLVPGPQMRVVKYAHQR